jgi:hypothetical protein
MAPSNLSADQLIQGFHLERLAALKRRFRIIWLRRVELAQATALPIIYRPNPPPRKGLELILEEDEE